MAIQKPRSAPAELSNKKRINNSIFSGTESFSGFTNAYKKTSGVKGEQDDQDWEMDFEKAQEIILRQLNQRDHGDRDIKDFLSQI
jgi:hypothetical protein